MVLAHEGKDKETALIGLSLVLPLGHERWIKRHLRISWLYQACNMIVLDQKFITVTFVMFPWVSLCYQMYASIKNKQTNNQRKHGQAVLWWTLTTKLCWNRAATVLRNARGDQIHMISFSGSLCLYSGRSLDFSFWRTLAFECSCIQKNKKEKMLKNPKISFGIGRESFSPLLPVSCHFENPQ